MQLLLLISVLIPLSTQQCLTSSSEVCKVSDAAHESLLQSELQFSVDLLRAAAKVDPEANLLLSPSSVFQASLLAYFFSANHTEASLKEALHLDSDKDKLDIFGAYSLDNYYQKLRAAKSRSYQLSSVNRIYAAKDLKLKYCMKVLFSEEIYPANFRENSEGVLKKINQWVATQTRNVIKDFLSNSDISKDTLLVLVNAAYFKGNWKSPFDENYSYEGKFHLSNGSDVTAMFMIQDGKFRYRIDKKLGVEVVELPYVGGNISMFVLLPVKVSATAVQDVLKKLDGKTLQNLVQALGAKGSSGPKITVTIPKFTVESQIQLVPILESLGFGDMFQASADFSTLGHGIRFSDAFHKAKIRVDEKGTEAAAATSFISDRAYTESFLANRPFIYTIYDRASNVPLFFGTFNFPEPKLL